MKKKLALWQAIKADVEAGLRVMLLYVLESIGSSPGRQGFAMMVNENGTMLGSIGGGIMEHKLVEMAKEMLQQPRIASPVIRKQLHQKSAAKNQSGMICSGEQTVCIYEVYTGDSKAVNSLIDSLQQQRECVLTLSPKGIEVAAGRIKSQYQYQFNSDEKWTYHEQAGYQYHLHLIGAGHCSLALSELMQRLDFYIHLYDDRHHLLTMEQNNFVHQKTIVDDYSQLQFLIASSKNNFVVIMTFGYRTDDIALRALMDKDFGYIGLLGSKAKVAKMFAAYNSEGIEDALLKRLRAPVGLPINSQSPEEIAISIAAQIIQVKNAVTT